MSVLPSVVCGLTAITALGAAIVDHEIPRRSSEALDRSVYRGSGDRRSVALTFDDGPCAQTPELLAYLAQQRVRATFFQLGTQLQRFPEIARQVRQAGHEIGNHGWSHTRLSPVFGKGWHLPSPRFMYRELSQTQRLLTDLHGEAPTLFRPPFGFRWVGLDAVQRRLGLRGIQWTVIGHDWEWPAERIAQHVISRVVPGAIICLHDGRDVSPQPDISETIRALKLILPVLQQDGYSFETVSELLGPRVEELSVTTPRAPSLS